MSFNSAAVNTLFDNVVSHAMELGVFATVNQHVPVNPPGQGLNLSVWIQSISPVKSSGINYVSGKVVLQARIYSSYMTEPMDGIDPQITTAVATLMNAYTGDFNFGATVRAVDLLGMEGTPLSAAAGYVVMGDNRTYRVMTLTVPVIINDMFEMSA